MLAANVRTGYATFIEVSIVFVLLPEGDLKIPVGAAGFEDVVRELRGVTAVEEWRRFGEVLRPIAAAANALPLLALRMNAF